ncbi:MAG: hypothetical protein AAFV49_21995, partial [Pseudomonadota bacterium]
TPEGIVPPPSTVRGGGETGTVPAVSGALIEIRFAPTATISAITTLLDGVGASIVAGPDEEGRYRIRLDAAATDRAPVEAALQSLRRDIALVRSVYEVP